MAFPVIKPLVDYASIVSRRGALGKNTSFSNTIGRLAWAPLTCPVWRPSWPSLSRRLLAAREFNSEYRAAHVRGHQSNGGRCRRVLPLTFCDRSPAGASCSCVDVIDLRGVVTVQWFVAPFIGRAVAHSATNSTTA